MALTQTGLFDKVNQAKQKSESAQKKENSILGDYENEIDKIVGSRDGITITEKQLDEIINKKIEEKLGNLNSLTNSLFQISYSSGNSLLAKGKRQISDFYTDSHIDGSNMSNYLEYDSTNKYIKVKKSGFYYITLSMYGSDTGDGQCIPHILINDVDMSAGNAWRSGYNSCINNNIQGTYYLKEGDNINFIADTGCDLKYYILDFNIYAN